MNVVPIVGIWACDKMLGNPSASLNLGGPTRPVQLAPFPPNKGQRVGRQSKKQSESLCAPLSATMRGHAGRQHLEKLQRRKTQCNAHRIRRLGERQTTLLDLLCLGFYDDRFGLTAPGLYGKEYALAGRVCELLGVSLHDQIQHGASVDILRNFFVQLISEIKDNQEARTLSSDRAVNLRDKLLFFSGLVQRRGSTGAEATSRQRPTSAVPSSIGACPADIPRCEICFPVLGHLSS